MPTLKRGKEVNAFYYVGYFITSLDLFILSGFEKWFEKLLYIFSLVAKVVG